MRRVVQLAGRDVELSADDERRWEAIEALFAGCPDSARTPQLRLQFARRSPALPDRTADLSYTGIDVWLDPEGVACRSVTGIAARRHGDDIRVGGPSDDPGASEPALDPALDLATAFRRSVQHVLADALAEHGRHTLHAASIRHGEHVVVALGGTGAGKSTLAYAASRHDWTVLSDDLTFVASDGDHLVAWGLPKSLNIPGDLIGDDQSGRGHAGLVIPDDERRRVRVPLERSYVLAGGRVSGVLLIEHGPGAGHVERMAPGPSLFKTLLPSFPLAPDRRRMRDLFPIAGALSRLPAWTLYHDADPTRRLDVAGRLLEQIVEALDGRAEEGDQ
jgi:hypothetical protein